MASSGASSSDGKKESPVLHAVRGLATGVASGLSKLIVGHPFGVCVLCTALHLFKASADANVLCAVDECRYTESAHAN